jgi:hypothetical protein
VTSEGQRKEHKILGSKDPEKEEAQEEANSEWSKKNGRG